MVFSSIPFICVFLPLLFVLYSLIRGNTLRNILLVIASLLFYSYGEPVYILLMLASIVVNYVFGSLAGSSHKHRKLWLVLAVIFNLGLLGIFKYAGFFVENINSLIGTQFPVPQLRLPIGISFFTFQALSYVIDVYRQEVPPQKNPGKLLLYITFFPQLIAGPIVKYHDIAPQLDNRTQTPQMTARGIRRFIIGLSKKLLIANTFALTADAIYALSDSQLNILSAWIGAIAYMLQIYYDFSGYSDMAIGLGQMFGFQFKENFNYPYSAVSIQDFWRRWHISLSTWFKEYLYIPLGGNRKGRLRTCINKLIVFFCTGFWHGANWTFVLWGLYHGFFLLLEEYLPKWRIFPFFKRCYTLLVVCIGFVIFRSDNLSQALSMVKQMFMGFHFDAGSMNMIWQQLTPLFIITLVIGIAFSFPVKLSLEKFFCKTTDNGLSIQGKIVYGLSYVLTILLLFICLLQLAGGTYNPFIYFRF